MAIFRGVGGSGDSSDSSFLQAVTEQAEAAEASRLASASAANLAVGFASTASTAATTATTQANSILNLTAATGDAGTNASYDASTGVLTIPRGNAGSDATVNTSNVTAAGAAMLTGGIFTGAVNVTGGALSVGSLSNNQNLNVLGNIIVSGTVDGVDITTRDGILTSTTTTANNALPKAGGQMTGNITFSGTETVDGRDVSVDGTKLDTLERVYRRRFAENAYSFSTVLSYLTSSFTPIIDEVRGHSTTGSENELDFQITATHYDINSANEFLFYVRLQAPYSGAEDTVNLGTVSGTSSLGSLKAFNVDGDVTKHLSPYCGMSTTSTGANAFSFDNNHTWTYNGVTNKTTIVVYAYQSNLPSDGDTLYLHPFDWESTGTFIIGDYYPADAYNASGTVNIRRDYKIYLGYFKNVPVLDVYAKETTSSENISINSVGGVLTQYQD